MNERVRRKAPSQARAKATVDAILEAAARVLVDDGFDAASTNRIAQVAGVSVGSLYQYFPSKEAIVADLIDRQADKMLGLLVQRLADHAGAPFGTMVRAVSRALMETIADDAPLNQVLLEQLPRVGRMPKLREWERRAAQVVQVALEGHRDEVRVQNLEVASLMLVHLVDGITITLATYHGDLLRTRAAADEMVDLIARYVMRD